MIALASFPPPAEAPPAAELPPLWRVDLECQTMAANPPTWWEGQAWSRHQAITLALAFAQHQVGPCKVRIIFAQELQP